MDKDTIKYAAAYLADELQEAREKKAGLLDNIAADPLRSAGIGAGIGGLVGGAGGGLLSMLRDKKERRRHSTLNDMLAGTLIGGGLGGAVGAIPGLFTGARKARVMPEAELPAKALGKPSVMEGAWQDAKNLVSIPTGAGAVDGILAGALAEQSWLRRDARRVLSSHPELAVDAARTIGMEIPKAPGAGKTRAAMTPNEILEAAHARGLNANAAEAAAAASAAEAVGKDSRAVEALQEMLHKNDLRKTLLGKLPSNLQSRSRIRTLLGKTPVSIGDYAKTLQVADDLVGSAKGVRMTRAKLLGRMLLYALGGGLAGSTFGSSPTAPANVPPAGGQE